MKLIFATNNIYKVNEIRAVLPASIEILSLKEAGIDIEIPEPYHTLEENAWAKSNFIWKLKGINCFSEDTGLEVAALNGEPGVMSARYAGENPSFDENVNRLLTNLEGMEHRAAQFRTVISLIDSGQETQFEGICEGSITLEKKGDNGFGYDPVFIPTGSAKTFAEMTLNEKKEFSHRSKAVEKLVLYLIENVNKI